MVQQERDEVAEVVERECWHQLPAGPVRSLWFSPPDGVVDRSVVLFPGLGLPRYLLPLAHTLAASGAEVVVFDALAFRRRRGRVVPTIHGLARAGAQWLATADLHGPVVVAGHSTGAQVALETVLSVASEVRPSVASEVRPSVASGVTVEGLVMAGPTFEPRQRRLRRLAPAALKAYRKDTPRELVVLRDLARVRTDVVRIVLSGLRHRPEDRVGALPVPLTLTAGEGDAFAPRGWLERLAAAAGGRSRVVVLPGSHNNVFPHAREVAPVVLDAVTPPRDRVDGVS
jgi:surfactin synthase thioesterase subunit